MARKKTQARIKAYQPETVHTVELFQLFDRLTAASVHAQWAYGVNADSRDWNGNMSYADALAAAQYGQWSAPSIDAITLPDMQAPSDDMRYFYDVTGDCLDVASFVAGEPEYWQVAEPVYKPTTKILKFAIEIGGLGDISATQLRNRGEAIIALVNSLELQGHSVEVTIVRAFSNAANENYKFLIPIKNAGQALDIKRFQFMVGHPAFYRRCLFALAEMAQGQNLNELSTRTANYRPDGFIHIGHATGRCDTKHESMQWANEFAHTLNSEN